MAAVSPAQPLPMMTTLYIQLSLNIRFSAPPGRYNEEGIVTSRRFAFRSAEQAAKLETEPCSGCVDPNQWTRLYCGTEIGSPEGKGQYGSALSRRQVLTAARSYARVSPPIPFATSGALPPPARL